MVPVAPTAEMYGAACHATASMAHAIAAAISVAPPPPPVVVDDAMVQRARGSLAEGWGSDPGDVHMRRAIAAALGVQG